MNVDQARKLIKVALPIQEISVESVRDRSLRHGHISTLHLWWALRPLATDWKLVSTLLGKPQALLAEGQERDIS